MPLNLIFNLTERSPSYFYKLPSHPPPSIESIVDEMQ